MDDLTELKSTLVAEASTFVTLFSSRLEASESDVETSAILESFWEVLDGDNGEDKDSREFRMSSTLQPSSLDLIPLLSPLLGRPASVRVPAEKLLLEGVGAYSSPREIMVAVGERIEAIVDEQDALDDDNHDSDPDEDGSSTDEQDDDHDHSDPHHHHHHASPTNLRYSPPSALTAELPTLLSLFALAIPRLTSKKSLATLLNLASMLPPALTAVPVTNSATARAVVDRLSALVEVTRRWALGKEDWSEKGEQKGQSILLGILASAVVHLYPALGVAPNAVGWGDGVRLLMSSTLPLLPSAPNSAPPASNPIPRSLLALLSSSHPLSTYAVLLLSAHITTTDPRSVLPDILSPSPTHILELLTTQDPDLLSRANAGGLPLVQACLSTFQTAISSPSSGPPPSTEVVASLFKTYLTPMATSPSAAQRKELFLLLKSMVLVPRVVPSPHTALALVLPLLSPAAALPTLRPVGLHFLQALIPTYGVKWLSEERALAKVSEAAFRLPFGEKDGKVGGEDVFVWSEKEDEDGEEWIRGPGPVCVVLGLGSYQLLLSRDRANESGVRSAAHLEPTKSTWLTPLRKRLDDRRKSQESAAEEDSDEEEEDESSGAWQAVEFALEGVERVLKGI